MKPDIVLHHDFGRDVMLGGANETFKALLDQAEMEGHHVEWCDWKAPLESPCYRRGPLHIIGNFARSTAQAISAVPAPRVVFCNNSIIRTNDVYETADLVVFLAPDHQERGTDVRNPRCIVHAPYIDHVNFINQGKVRNSEQYLFIGDLFPDKISEAMVRGCPRPMVAVGNSSRAAYVAKLRELGVEVHASIDPLDVPTLMNRYERIYWRLNRYGCYGRVILEAALCGMEVDVNRENFGLFSYDWAPEVFDKSNKISRRRLVEVLEEELCSFWVRVLTKLG